MESKTCSKCALVKPLAEFYSYSAQCKPCVVARVQAHRIANLDRARAYDRARAVEPHRIENATRVTRAWRRKYRDRLAAQNKANRAALVAPLLCEGCHQPRRLEKHHPDYSKPLLVAWLCKPCHAAADKVRRQLEAC